MKAGFSVFFTVFVAALLLSSASFAAERKFASAYISEGMADYDQGNYIEAILNLRNAEQLSPNPSEVGKYLGLAYGKMSLWRQAAKEFDKILFVNPSDPDRGLIVSDIREWEGMTEYTPAMAQYSFYSIKYKNRIFSEPENLLNYLSLTEIYKCSGRYEEAESFFRALIRERPNQDIFKKYLAEVLLLDGKFAEAGKLVPQDTGRRSRSMSTRRSASTLCSSSATRAPWKSIREINPCT